MKKVLVYLVCLMLVWAVTITGPVMASELVYQPINPSFGGSPLNGQWLLNSAQIQDPHGFSKDKKEPLIPERNTLEMFEERLTSQLLYRLSGEIVNAAFGEEGLEPGIYTVGDYIINITTGIDGIKMIITDIGSGNSTTIEVPYY